MHPLSPNISTSSPRLGIEKRVSIDEYPAEIKTRDNRIRLFFRQHGHNLINELRSIFTWHPQEWLSAFRKNSKYPLFVQGDIDGLVALFIDNLATLLAIILALQTVFDADIVYGRIVTG
jgi:hypothetical protein